jgi:hypothetical protein
VNWKLFCNFAAVKFLDRKIMKALQQKRVLDSEISDKIHFMAFIITQFARAYKIEKQ